MTTESKNGLILQGPVWDLSGPVQPMVRRCLLDSLNEWDRHVKQTPKVPKQLKVTRETM